VPPLQDFPADWAKDRDLCWATVQRLLAAMCFDLHDFLSLTRYEPFYPARPILSSG